MILITGATGLLGSHLALYLLEQGENVRAICRNTVAAEKTKSVFNLYKKAHLFDTIDWVEADITETPSLENAFKDIEYVYHCAAAISFDPADENLLRKTNIEGTANIVNFCLEYRIKKICYVSSIAALGDLKEYEHTISEDTEWNSEKHHTDYAISKYGAEMEVFRARQEGLMSVIVNPGVILGPLGNNRWNTSSGEIFTRVANGLTFYTKGAIGFVSVGDVVRIMVELMKNETTGERFILVSQNLSYETVLRWIADALKVERPKMHAKPWLTEIIWRLDWLLSAVFQSKRKFPKSIARTVHTGSEISNNKIKSLLGYEFEDIKDYITTIAAFYPK